MTKPSRSKIRGVLSSFALALLALSSGACQKPQIVVENENAAAWMAFTNRLPHAPGDRAIRRGILFQLGAYDGVDTTEFKDIVLTKDDGKIYLEPSTDTLWWVNVVAEVAGSPGDPIQPEEAVGLFRNKARYEPSCDDLVFALIDTLPKNLRWCVDGNDQASGTSTTPDCPNTDQLRKRCLRGRELHVDFKVKSLLTFWHGSNGYTLETELPSGDPLEPDRFVITIEDPIQVQVYKTDPTVDEPTFTTPEESFPAGEILKIEIGWKPKKPKEKVDEHNAHKSPPW